MKSEKRNADWNLIACAAIIGAIAPIAVLAMLWFIGLESKAFFGDHGWRDLLALDWRPVAASYGLAPLVTATFEMAAIATGLSVLFGIPAAVRLVFFAGDRESLVCQAALGAMAGLPSVIVGLAGLTLLVPAMGFTMISGAATLFVMIFPVFTLLVAAALRQEGDRLRPCGYALGYSRRDFVYRIVLRAVLPSIILAATLGLGKAMGEATAVSLVIGNISAGVLPDLFGPANTLTTAILKDHAAATGAHLSALYVAATTLSVLILTLNLLGAGLARAVRRRLSLS